MARPTTDLAEWLGRHGLGQYVQTFAENNIEYFILPDLTEDDLEKLGVSLGHRKKLLRAIEALTAAGQRTGTTTAVSNVTEVLPTTSAPSQASASVQDGPASNWVRSRTRTPARKAGNPVFVAIFSSSPSVASVAPDDGCRGH